MFQVPPEIDKHEERLEIRKSDDIEDLTPPRDENDDLVQPEDDVEGTPPTEDDFEEGDVEAKEKEEKKFECTQCDKSFSREKGLRVHSLVHKEKPYCQICSKQFSCMLPPNTAIPCL